MSERARGIVKWYSLAKGYGFIRPVDGEQAGDDPEDIFVHHTAVTGEPLVEGERVHFEIAESPKGLKALNVRRAVDEPA